MQMSPLLALTWWSESLGMRPPTSRIDGSLLMPSGNEISNQKPVDFIAIMANWKAAAKKAAGRF